MRVGFFLGCAALMLANAAPAVASTLNPLGQWGDKDEPKGPADYLVQPQGANGQIRMILPEEMKIPSGRSISLRQVSVGQWRSMPNTQPSVMFDMTGPRSAHIKIAGGAKGAGMFSGWALNMDDQLVKR